MIQIRPCTPNDAAAVRALLGELGYAMSLPQSAVNVRELCKTGSDPILLATANARVVGLLAAHLCRMLQYASLVMRITVLVVDPRARRNGVGRLLMERAEHIGAAAGCEFIELTSAMNRADAHAFYSSLGYQPNSLRFHKRLVLER